MIAARVGVHPKPRPSSGLMIGSSNRWWIVGVRGNFRRGHLRADWRRQPLRLIPFHELPHRLAAEGLARLVTMVASRRLHPQIEAAYEQIAEVASKLYSRGIEGKAVLHF